MVLPEIEIARILQENSGCSDVGEKACMWNDKGVSKGVSWDCSFGEWGLGSMLYKLGETGFHPNIMAIYVGIDKDDLACYVTFDPDS